MTESCRRVWRDGIVPQLSTRALSKLRDALLSDDPRLQQGATMMPLPHGGVKDCPVESACAISYCGWQGEGLETVGEVERYLNRVCVTVNSRFTEDPGAVRHFLQWFDSTPREQMRRELLEEVDLALAQRPAP